MINVSERWTRMALAGLIATGVAATAHAQSAENVLLVVNERSPDSVTIGDHYAAARGLPDEQVVRLDLEPTETISRAAYRLRVEQPIERWLLRHRANDRILYIVLTKGVPLTVIGTVGRGGSLSSVDSELTLLYRRQLGDALPPGGRVDNPYFQPDIAEPDAAVAFTHERYDIYLVTRLDGFDVDDVIALIDRGLDAGRDGSILLDRRADPRSPADRWLVEAADLVGGDDPPRIVLEETTRAAVGVPPLLGYFSWGSNDPALTTRDRGLTFAPGAIASTFVGTSARTFTAPPDTWEVGSWRDRRTFYAGSPEELLADLVRQGVTGAAGHVADPYLDGAVRPGPLFASYLSGLGLAEAFYAALPDLSWRAVVVGDPLVRPFADRRPPLSADVLDPPLDPATGLAAFFAARRVGRLTDEGMGTETATLLIRADLQWLDGDEAGSLATLESVVERDDAPDTARVRLAQIHHDAGRRDQAIAAYQTLLDRDPDDVTTLNNLAYLLAEEPTGLDQAYEHAQRAFALTPGDPRVADTLGWVHHLRGDQEEALRYVTAAARALPGQPDVRLHLARVLADMGQIGRARGELEAALELDAELAGTPEVEALRAVVGGAQDAPR